MRFSFVAFVNNHTVTNAHPTPTLLLFGPVEGRKSQRRSPQVPTNPAHHTKHGPCDSSDHLEAPTDITILN